MADVSPEQLAAALEASAYVLGRFSGPELFQSTPIVGMAQTSGLTIVQLPRTFNLNRPVAQVLVQWKGRINVTVAPYASVAPEALPNLLQNMQVQGTHKDFGQLTPCYISGATQMQWNAMFGAFGACSIIVNGVYVPTIAGRPMVSSFLGQVGTYDVDMTYVYDVGSWQGMGNSAKRQYTNEVWTQEDWGDTLQLQTKWGDASALGDATGATVTFTAFESASGNPTQNVYLNYTLLGDFAGMVRTGVTIRSEQPCSQQQTALTNNAVVQTLQKQITPNVMLKTGTTQTTGLTAGVSTLATLSDRQFNRTQLIVDNKPLRNNSDNMSFKANVERWWGARIAQGYFLMPFTEAQSFLLSYRGDSLAGGANFQVQTDVTEASANNRQFIIQEMMLGGPFPATR